MKKSILLPLLLIHITFVLYSQRPMTPDVYSEWQVVKDPRLSDDGKFSFYIQEAEQHDPFLFLHDNSSGTDTIFERVKSYKVLSEVNQLVYQCSAGRDTLVNAKRKKVKKDDMPGDSLVIYNYDIKKIVVVPSLKSYKVPEKLNGIVAYQIKLEEDKGDSTVTKTNADDNALNLTVLNFKLGLEKKFPDVTSYEVSNQGDAIFFQSKGDGNDFRPGIYAYSTKYDSLRLIFNGKQKIEKLICSTDGQNAAFIYNSDTTKTLDKAFEIWLSTNWNEAVLVADTSYSQRLGRQWINSKNIYFNKDGNALFFGINPKPIVQDTNLLDEEIVNVEVWNTITPKLYTQQEIDLDADKNDSKDVVYHISTDEKVLLEKDEINTIVYPRDRALEFAIGLSDTHYEKYMQWNGYIYHDIYLLDLKDGLKRKLADKVAGNPSFSEGGKYIFWFDLEKSSYYFYQINSGTTSVLRQSKTLMLTDELNDVPQFAEEYGIAGWTQEDERVWVYDRYDVFSVNPGFTGEVRKITNGRSDRNKYRCIFLEEEDRAIHFPVLFHIFNEESKKEGYARLEKGAQPLTLFLNDFSWDASPVKARESNVLLTTKQSFQVFPDLMLADSNFLHFDRISNANPQQGEYLWGSAELFSWKNKKGEKLEGLLFKPANFDSSKQYPLIVNFYERSSNTLNSHRTPLAHRSSINYTYYTSNGYVIFNPDVTYENGYPGESCYDDVISGVIALTKNGYIDEKKMGLQGHSWGGYQVAYLLTRTNMFKCAESGAPVVNMTSAYGGIRWGSGMNRMFQYERTQSRIGKTLWEDRELYLKNSPLFSMDQVQTPVLILHNDGDTAVPWYQGIEYFTALRRLGKRAWLLNYNDEPHWPVKWQNRLDFNIRMEQFFDFYLKGKKMPKWMVDGVPAIEKGIKQRLETNY